MAALIFKKEECINQKQDLLNLSFQMRPLGPLYKDGGQEVESFLITTLIETVKKLKKAGMAC